MLSCTGDLCTMNALISWNAWRDYNNTVCDVTAHNSILTHRQWSRDGQADMTHQLHVRSWSPGRGRLDKVMCTQCQVVEMAEGSLPMDLL